mmetsp:Transcript_79641/g.174632  ORF Transcript_79641/g.174632 Transcript_79641/m.174632 type:complete len:248 (+) Transcript_79641:910-1653(+)
MLPDGVEVRNVDQAVTSSSGHVLVDHGNGSLAVLQGSTCAVDRGAQGNVAMFIRRGDLHQGDVWGVDLLLEQGRDLVQEDRAVLRPIVVHGRSEVAASEQAQGGDVLGSLLIRDGALALQVHVDGSDALHLLLLGQVDHGVDQGVGGSSNTLDEDHVTRLQVSCDGFLSGGNLLGDNALAGSSRVGRSGAEGTAAANDCLSLHAPGERLTRLHGSRHCHHGANHKVSGTQKRVWEWSTKIVDKSHRT